MYASYVHVVLVGPRDACRVRCGLRRSAGEKWATADWPLRTGHCGLATAHWDWRPRLRSPVRWGVAVAGATEGGFLDNRVVGGGPEDGWVGLTLNA